MGILSMVTTTFSSAQVVDIGLNTGIIKLSTRSIDAGIDEFNVGLSTWKWLYIGTALQECNYLLPGESPNKFYTVSLYLQPTITVSNSICLYGRGYYGYLWYRQAQTIGDILTGSTRDFAASCGVNYKVVSSWLYVNAEVAYLHYAISGTEATSWSRSRSAITNNCTYATVGLHALLNRAKHTHKVTKE